MKQFGVKQVFFRFRFGFIIFITENVISLALDF